MITKTQWKRFYNSVLKVRKEGKRILIMKHPIYRMDDDKIILDQDGFYVTFSHPESFSENPNMSLHRLYSLVELTVTLNEWEER